MLKKSWKIPAAIFAALILAAACVLFLPSSKESTPEETYRIVTGENKEQLVSGSEPGSYIIRPDGEGTVQVHLWTYQRVPSCQGMIRPR